MNTSGVHTSPSSTASSSLHRRYGLSPRQRRLLQAAARARAHPADSSLLSTKPIHATPSSSLAASPSSLSNPISLSVSMSPISIETASPASEEKYVVDRSSTTSLDNSTTRQVENKVSADGSGSSTTTTEATTVSIRDDLRRLRLSPVHDVHEAELAEAMRGKVSDRIRRFSIGQTTKKDASPKSAGNLKFGTQKANSTSDDTNNTRQVDAKGPLHAECEQSAMTTIDCTKKRMNVREKELRYYKIVYRGMVSLLPEIDTGQYDASQLTCAPIIDTNNDGASVVYGEIVATSSPEFTIPLTKLDRIHERDKEIKMLNRAEEKYVKVIRVDAILTGGYVQDKKQSLDMTNISASHTLSDSIYHYGYLLLEDRFTKTIAELIQHTKPGFDCPSYERGSFIYRVSASSPVRVLSGPHFNAPAMKFALLPGTIQRISLRLTLSISKPISDNEAGDILVDDADAGEMKFLRLDQRRGWVADRRVDTVDGDAKKLRVTYLMKDVTDENTVSYTRGRTPRTFYSYDSSLHSLMTIHPMQSSSFYSNVKVSSVKSPHIVTSKRMYSTKSRHFLEESHSKSPFLLQESRRRDVGEFFDLESNDGMKGASSKSGSSTSELKPLSVTESLYLIRVMAPLGLKILDAPHFQVSNLITTPHQEHFSSRSNSPGGISPFARTNAMINSMSTETSPPSTGGKKRNTRRFRFLARGQIFEASERMESPVAASIYTNGQGLIKLSDGSGWVIIPHHADLVAQFENNQSEPVEMNDIKAYDEIGNAIIHKSLTASHQFTQTDKLQKTSVVWLRIISLNGVRVLLPPTDLNQPMRNKEFLSTSPNHIQYGERLTYIKHTTSNFDLEASFTGSTTFLDSVWSKVNPTNHKEKLNLASCNHRGFAARSQMKNLISSESEARNPFMDTKTPAGHVISCGMVVPVELWDTATSDSDTRCYVRLFNGQGWIPRRMGNVSCAIEVDPPDARFGSFWFRVQSNSGILVRHGPSSDAHPIISSCGASFRFECGEYLRSSEVLTIFDKFSYQLPEPHKSGANAECFARLYRKQYNPNEEDYNRFDTRYSSIKSLTIPGEWVQVYGRDKLFLQECSMPPEIERNREGWRYRADQHIRIRRGPSFRAGVTGSVISINNEFVVTEKVKTFQDEVIWLRLKNNEGWVHTITETGDIVMCSLAVSKIE